MNKSIIGLMMAVVAVAGCGGGSTESTTTEGSDTTGGTETTEATESTTDQSGTDSSTNQQGGLPGGWADGDVNDSGTRDAAAFAVQEQSRVSGDTIQLVSIAWVSQQVVSGMNYRLGLNITRNGTAEQATAAVYSQPWTSTTQLTGWTSGAAR